MACIQSIADKEKTLITAKTAPSKAPGRPSRRQRPSSPRVRTSGRHRAAIEALGTRRADAEARLRSFRAGPQSRARAQRRPETPSSQRSRRKSPAGRSASPTTPNGRPCSKTADARPRRTRPAISSKTPLRQRTASETSSWEGLNGYRTAAKTEYERLTAAFQQAKAAYTAIGDPAAELEEIAAEEAGHLQLAGLAPKLAAAETLVEELTKTIETEEARIRETTKAIEEANDAALPQYRRSPHSRRGRQSSPGTRRRRWPTLYPSVGRHRPQRTPCVRRCPPRGRHREQLQQKQATATVEAAAIRSEIPAETGGSTLSGPHGPPPGTGGNRQRPPGQQGRHQNEARAPSPRQRSRPGSTARTSRPSPEPSTTTRRSCRRSGSTASST